MNKLLIAQRILIYSMALEYVEDMYFCGLCQGLRTAAVRLGINDNEATHMAYYDMETEYPEVWDHRPEQGVEGYWWPIGYKSTRIGVLQQSIEELYDKLK